MTAMQSDMQDIKYRLDRLEARMDKMEARLDNVEGTLEELVEEHQITRNGVNTLLEWAESCSRALDFPLPQVAV